MRFYDTAFRQEIGASLRWNDHSATGVKYRMAPLQHPARVLASLCSALLLSPSLPGQLSGAGRIAYVHAPDGGPPWPVEDIYSMAADGSSVKALTTDGHSHDPAWSSDGRRILFIHDSALQGTPPYPEQRGYETYHPVGLYVMDADGGNPHLLRRLEPVIFTAALSPDSKNLAITCMPQEWANQPQPAGEPMRAGLFLLPSDGQGKLRFLVQNGFQPVWSPDGRKLAFSVEHPGGLWSVHVANADGSDDVRLTDPQNTGGSPAWSPDSKQIAFDEFVDRRQQIFVMGADGSHARQLTGDQNWSCTHPSWSPDGTQIVFSCRSASRPCGVVSSIGTVLPECERRIFTLSLRDPNAKPKQIGKQDGAAPVFAPVP